VGSQQFTLLYAMVGACSARPAPDYF
jgi:hypothetical protein